MQVAVTWFEPVDEFNTEFERALGVADKIVLIDLQHGKVAAYGGDGSLADANNANRIGFNQFNTSVAIVEAPGQTSSRHPAGGAAANNDNAVESFCHIDVPFTVVPLSAIVRAV